MEQRIRQPIVVTLGHVDHGKTTLLDSVRGTGVAVGEAGGITQSIGATNIPAEIIRKISKQLLEKFQIKMEIPGLLFIDTPGHEAFASLRKRGGSVADLAILVVDINEGFQIQTDESLNLLKQFKVPFIVAATKIDRIPGWFPNKKMSFSDSFAKQRDDIRDDLENKLYKLVAQLIDRGFDSERFDRIGNFTKQVAIVPCSGMTGEGVAEVLLMLAGLSQQFLKGKLQLSETAKGSVLEVKDVKGLGTTIDVILYDGKIKTGDYIVVGGREPIVTKIRTLLEPRSLQELRVERQFNYVNEVSASTGVKISAVGLDAVIAGSPIVVVKSEEQVENVKKEVLKEIELVMYDKNDDGVTIKADTLGSLEAMIKIFQQKNIPIKSAEAGNVTRQDLLEVQNVSDGIRRVILVFNKKVPEEISISAKDLGVKIFENNVIYRLLEEYEQWSKKEVERKIQEKLEGVSRPCKVRFLPGSIFRQHSPAVFGVEVLDGVVKTGITLMKINGKTIGKVKEIQKEGKAIDEAKKGDRVAISVDEPTIGRHISEGETLVSYISETDAKVLKECSSHLSESEQELLKSLFK